MRQNRGMTDEKRLALIEEYLSSGKSKYAFEKEKGLSHKCISKWIRTFAFEDNAAVIMPQSAVTDMKKDPDKEELLQEIARLKQELRFKLLDLKRTEMARDAYERMIVLAEERYGIPIRKKSGAK
jgi:transposase-like protein